MHMSMRVKTLRRLFFPPKCAACGELLEAFRDASPRALCKNCLVKWDQAKNRPCQCCGLPVMDCTESPAMPKRHGIDTLIRLARYVPDKKYEIANRVIFKLKDKDSIELQEYLAAELVPMIEKQLRMLGQTPENTVFVWAPRSVQAERRVGHDQSKRLCYALCRAFGKEKPLCMLRRTGGRVQKRLGQTERRKNAFSAFEAVDKNCVQLKGKCVVLVDDVVTTGATLSACSAKLKPYGPAVVIAACIAVDTPQNHT